MLLSLRSVAAAYSGLRALDGVSLDLDTGAATAVVGPNGAGKTTMANVVAGTMRPVAGSVELFGRPAARSAHARRRAGIGYVPEGRRVFAELSVHDNLLVGCRDRDLGAAGMVDEVCELFPILGNRLRQAAGTLSGGEQQALAIARALMNRPRLLILDEPTMGLAPIVVARVHEHLAAVRARGVALLVFEQSPARVPEACDDVHLLVRGRVTFSAPQGSPQLDEVLSAALSGSGSAHEAQHAPA